MSGLDTSQAITDAASLHSEEYHVHSLPEAEQAAVHDEAAASGQPDAEAEPAS
ncbi:MAG: hypothetical protein JWM64_2860 [Frankiales bacterium]|nr:hypothetical protein [Frankiales bacterium]